MSGAAARPLPRAAETPVRRPRLGFLGLGWIGRSRLQALCEAEVAEVCALADPAPDCLAAALEIAPAPSVLEGLDDLLQQELDGIVIATPSALHARQSAEALERGLHVFCQKPLARTAADAARVIETARRVDRALGVDLSYRRTRAAEAVRTSVRSGELGRVFAVDLEFHNAYGPDRPWFYRRSQAGGGCLMDLGTHLLDLALWILEPDPVVDVRAELRASGRPLLPKTDAVEDWAALTVRMASDTVVRISCSWNLSAGRDAVIGAAFYGTDGAAVLRNVDGSFYDLRADRHHGTGSEPLTVPPDAWGGRALLHWVQHITGGGGFDPAIESTLAVARALDRAYGR